MSAELIIAAIVLLSVVWYAGHEIGIIHERERQINSKWLNPQDLKDNPSLNPQHQTHEQHHQHNR